MLFSSIFFLYFFLPTVLLAHYLVGKNLRNVLLLLASLFFYTWGETNYVAILLISICVNYVVGLSIKYALKKGKSGRRHLAIGIFLNLTPLFFFKYYVFIAESLNAIISNQQAIIPTPDIHLPIGISFFTFQAISYIVDVYRGDAEVQKNPLKLALYISLFPQLIAGPIVRYHDIYKQLSNRTVSIEDLKIGVVRFVAGFGKKVLIANNMGSLADHVFSLPANELSFTIAWLGIAAYTLQIYFDFSGYSDMAIGLGRMFGFKFLENFNYPYISRSIREFWRRWHISLSFWFRDYLYIPLGGSRCAKWRISLNLMTVFFLCGLWHGASWMFVIWGLFHGFFIVIESTIWGDFLLKLPKFIQHCYTLVIIMVGWIFFRADSLSHAIDYMGALVNFQAAPYIDGRLHHATGNEFIVAFTLGILFSVPIVPTVNQWINHIYSRKDQSIQWVISGTCTTLLTGWMVVTILYSTAAILRGTHNPFLYFRF